MSDRAGMLEGAEVIVEHASDTAHIAQQRAIATPGWQLADPRVRMADITGTREGGHYHEWRTLQVPVMSAIPSNGGHYRYPKGVYARKRNGAVRVA